LRNKDTLSAKLLLEPHRSAIRADAHGALRVEANEGVLWSVANGNRLSLNLRSVDGQRGFAFNVYVNCS
jgi:hypothetical protein